ncbi:voltage-gated potassium channel [Dothidotthia symphoricarpi CBS 119687]|uniref:Voltage-gated potassium channel n=1 Tax=Dothidotthia symphoricarpi CBS 119687 TaxID=1392245 RepID=A0A6A6A9W3_9PLEO|nr:voltage-gated potassium channel [Dothidotthia symphoricarpi CBS 119687]KAF2127648.1 voltage-gated potassium channel [Dothidotthia symphoricarpi CBS 119687]
MELQQDTIMEEPFGLKDTEPKREREKKKKQRHGWRRRRRGEDEEIDWWFASTGIPLLAATLGPLANVTSIAALVTSWRQTNYLNNVFVPDFNGIPYADPHWCYWLNAASLICGFLGNIFLLLNFTQRIRYLIALPATILFWFCSSGLLIASTACMEVFAPPHRPYETYTQGFWYAVASATFYTVCALLLMGNMLGYYLGRYPDTFALSDSQRTLILQTMGFFIWLGGGAAVYTRIEKRDGVRWSFADALYFCDVTILTVGFGDLAPTTNIGRGIVFPYSVGGILTLALVVSALYRFMRDIGEEKIVQKRVNRERMRALQRTTPPPPSDLRHREHKAHHLIQRRAPVGQPRISAPSSLRPFRTAIPRMPKKPNHQARMQLLTEEKARFEAMRAIQLSTKKYKKWLSLLWSLSLFLLLWCIGALVFWQTEKHTQNMTYFQALYFCYISLLTIGYGDLSPQSNAGRCFFVVWSLIAVPSMTILVSDLGDTVVAVFKARVDGVADFTVLPREGVWRGFLDAHPALLGRLRERAGRRRVERGFEAGEGEAGVELGRAGGFNDVEAPAEAEEVDVETTPHTHTHASLSRHLAHTIKSVSLDLRLPRPKRYAYEEWVEFTRLIRFTTPQIDPDERRGGGGGRDRGGDGGEDGGEDGGGGRAEEQGLVEWDWIGADSPMTSGLSESEWVLERLCESLIRLQMRREEGVGG